MSSITSKNRRTSCQSCSLATPFSLVSKPMFCIIHLSFHLLLLIGGCGKFFEGNADEMHRALTKVIGSLPQDTQIYCGHEYTVSNLIFGKEIEPNNEQLK